MNTDQFWLLIDSAAAKSKGDEEAFLDRLRSDLSRLPPQEMLECQQRLTEQIARANTYDLLGAAYLLNGEGSDDGFEYFRAWLVSRGRRVFEGAVADADSLASIDAEECWLEELLYLPAEVYEEVTDRDAHEALPGDETVPSEPAGNPWADVDELRERLPRLWGKVNHQ